MAQVKTTSKFKPLPDYQKKIGYRLTYIRKCQGVAQDRLASDIGLTLAQLANIEAGRVPLKAAAAWNISQHLDVHPRWLLSGHNESPFPSPSATQKKWFDAVVSKHGAKTFWDFWSRFGFLFLDDQSDYFEEVARHGVIPEWSNAGENEELTNQVNTLTNDGVKPVLPKLIQRLKRVTSKRGQKTKLADWLGVHRQSVTDWLSGKQEPGGEITLRLLKWVEQQERQK